MLKAFLSIFLIVNTLYSSEYIFDRESDSSSFVYGCVNAITGAYVDTDYDIEIEGPEPLKLERFYNSHNANLNKKNYLGIGYSAYPCFIKEIEFSKGRAFVNVEEAGGSYLGFWSKHPKRGEHFYLDAHMPTYGMTNSGQGEITGRNNLKNTVLHCPGRAKYEKKCDWIAFLPDGGKRFYSKNGRLTHEVKPNGNKVFYSYDQWKRISRIWTTDRDESITLNWLNFSYADVGACYGIEPRLTSTTVRASNGKEVTYCLFEKNQRIGEGNRKHYEKYNVLQDVINSSRPLSHYTYHKPGVSVTNEISNYTMPDGRYIEIGTKDHKVSSLTLPCGEGSSPVVIYRFNYDSKAHQTHVVDAYDNRIAYYYTPQNWLSDVVYYEQNKGHYKTKCLYWGPLRSKRPQGLPQIDNSGFLITKGLKNQHGELVRATHYVYDERGNPLKEISLGDLTGAISNVSIILDKEHKPIKGNYESYFREKTFSNDGFNLTLSEQEENGPYTEYTYVPGTDLLASKLVYEDGRICMRQFYEYDHCAVLTKSMADDGISGDKNDLTGISERKITIVTPKYHAPGIGKPESIKECYLDLTSGQEKLLKRTNYTYGQNDLITQEDVYDENNNHCYTTRVKYDAHDNVIEQIDSIGDTTIFCYDANDNKIYEEKVGSGYKTHFSYDRCNNLIAQEEIHHDLSLITRYKYDLMGRKVALIDCYGHETSYIYDAFGREIEVVYPINAQGYRPTERKEYTVTDCVSSFTDKEGNTTHTEYNSNCKPKKISYPDGSFERFEYQKNGLLLKKWERSGACVVYAYDLLGRIIQEEGFENNLSVYKKFFEYNIFHLLRTYDKMNHCTEYQYDGAGKKIAEIKCGQEKITYEYDSLGRLNKTYTWFNEDEYNVTIQEFDFLNRVVAEYIEDNKGKIYQKSTSAYDINGNKTETITYINSDTIAIDRILYNSKNEITEKIDALGNATKMVYDHQYINEFGQKVLRKETIDPLGNRTIETYDIDQRVVSLEKQNVNHEQLAFVEYFFDQMGREVLQKHTIITEHQPKGFYTIASSYDSMGNLLILNEMEKETRYRYDLSGRLQTLVKPDGVTLNHAYDLFGHLLSLTSSDGTIDYAYQYDSNDHLIQVLDHGERSELYIYNDLGYLVEELLANGHKIKYSYDLTGRLTKVILPDQSFILYSYNNIDLVSIVRFDANSKKLYSHEYLETDWDGNLLSAQLIGNAGLLTYEYDLLGRQRSNKSDQFLETIPRFDAVGNLLQIDYQDPRGKVSTSYSYDNLYQLIQEADTSYVYDSINNRLRKDNDVYKITPLNQVASTSSTEYSYDRSGNLIRALSDEKEMTYTYDALNRLVAINNGETEYSYDSSGRRMGKTGMTFIYQKNCEIGSYDSKGALTLRILGKGRGAEVRASVAIETNGQIYVPIHDHRGNITVLVDSITGRPAETIRYTAFGDATIFGPTITPWQLASKRFDPETGFVFFSNRYYSPEIAKWITPDPLGFADGPNLYAYVHNSPLTFFDPYGLFGFSFSWSNTKNWAMDAYKGFGEAVEDNFPIEAFGIAPQVYLYFKDSEAYKKRCKESNEGLKALWDSFKNAPGKTVANSFFPKAMEAWQSPSVKNCSAAITEAGLTFLPGSKFSSAAKAARVTKAANAATLINRIAKLEASSTALASLSRRSTTVASESIANGLRNSSKQAVQKYTKSNFALGQQMHKEYKLNMAGLPNMYKEYRKIPGIRPDFVDMSAKKVYELKPYNPRAMKQGTKQLEKYKLLLEEEHGGTWETFLDFY